MRRLKFQGVDQSKTLRTFTTTCHFYHRRSRMVIMSLWDQSFYKGVWDPVLCFSIVRYILGTQDHLVLCPKNFGGTGQYCVPVQGDKFLGQRIRILGFGDTGSPSSQPQKILGHRISITISTCSAGNINVNVVVIITKKSSHHCLCSLCFVCHQYYYFILTRILE